MTNLTKMEFDVEELKKALIEKCESEGILYERALAEAPQELVKLDEVLHGNGTLSPRFDHNFD